MDRATASALDSLHALELRVLEGPQGGARAPIPSGSAWVLATQAPGGAAVADIALHEPSAPPARVRVSAEVAHALLEVLDGEVRLGDQVLSAGAQAPWPRAMPLVLGSSIVAWGLACVDDWKLAPSAAAGAPLLTDAVGAPAGAAPRKPLHRRAEVWLAATGCAVLVACLGTLGMARVVAAPRAAATVPASLAERLQASEFSSLTLRTSADGRTTVHGRLGTLAERARLDAWLAGHDAAPVVDVKVDETLARDVADVFRVNGVTVRTRVAGPGRIDAEAAEPDAARVARAEEVVRRDVRGLERLAVVNTARPAPPPPPPVVDDPGKRIASLVQGDPSYVVTADGSRYFVGALLPTGHRITEVAPQRVTLELNGQRSTLNF